MKNNHPRGLRNNNPLNIIKNKTVRWLGETNCESERTFCTFSSMTFGLRAALKLLRTYYQRHGCVTIRQIIRRWAPETENKTEVYIHVKLAAVGASEQLAGLIRFPYTVKNDSTALITMDDIDSLYTIGGKSFDVNMHGEQIKQQNRIANQPKLSV